MKGSSRVGVGMRRVIACALFVCLFLTLLTYVERILMEKNAERALVAHEAIPPYSADVVFLGSSHVYGGIIPQKLMDDHGISSVNAASALQPVWQGVYELEWLFQRQKPRVVVLDLFLLGKLPRGIDIASEAEFDDRYYSFLGVLHRAMPWTNPVKYTTSFREAWMDPFAIPYLSAVSVRHPELWKTDLESFWRAEGKTISHATFNYFYLSEVFDDFPKAFPAADPDAAFSEFMREQLALIAKICEKNQAQLLLTAVPFWPGAEWLSMAEQVRLWAEEGNITNVAYLPMEDIIEGSGFDFGRDMADDGHANFSGAKKTTAYVGQYLKAHYELADRREDTDARYDPWKKRPYQYEAYDVASYMRYVKDIDEWSMLAENLNEDYLVILAYNQEYDRRKPEWENYDIVSLLEMIGLEEIGTFLEEDANYFAIMDGATVREENLVHGELDYAALENGFPLTIRTENGGNLQVKLENREISCGHEGLNLIFYNKVENKVIRAICIDLCGEEISFVH